MFNALFSESGHAAAMNIKIRPHNVACLVLDNLLSRELHNLNKMNFPALKMAGFSVNAPLWLSTKPHQPSAFVDGAASIQSSSSL